MALWTNVLLELKLKISKASYETWSKDTKIAAINKDDGILTIELPTEFTLCWIQTKYSKLISETIYELTNKDYKLKLITKPEQVTSDNQQKNYTKDIINNSLEEKVNLLLARVDRLEEPISELEEKI